MFSVTALACALLVMLAFPDFRRRRLPNALVAGFALLYFAQAWLAGEDRPGLEIHVAVGVTALVVAAHQARNPLIQGHRLPENRGAIANWLNALRQAKGEFMAYARIASRQCNAGAVPTEKCKKGRRRPT